MVDFCRDMLTGNFQISQEMITIVRIYRKYFPENQHLLINIFAGLAAITSVAWYCMLKYCNTKDQKVAYVYECLELELSIVFLLFNSISVLYHRLNDKKLINIAR